MAPLAGEEIVARPGPDHIGSRPAVVAGVTEDAVVAGASGQVVLASAHR